jgi:hypothetical protein
LKEKRRENFAKVVFFLYKASANWHMKSWRDWPTWTSNVLVSHHILRIWTRRITTCSLKWKINSNVVNFRPTQKSLLSRRTGWTDKLLNFVLWIAESRTTS